MTNTPATNTIQWSAPEREAAFNEWIHSIADPYALNPQSLSYASADASFRRYFRIQTTQHESEPAHPTPASYIVMDTPPEHDNGDSFARVAKLFQLANIKAVHVLEWDADNGFMLLPDLGTHTLLQKLSQEQNSTSAPKESYFLQAIDMLISWQLASKPHVLPDYDTNLLHKELDLFPEWYIARHRQYVLKEKQRHTIQTVFQTLVKHNLQAAPVFVHRDYMPRNLMVQSDDTLAILDFQDAVYGPITYDIACLLKDAFISWEEEFVLDMTVRYWERAKRFGLPVDADFGNFYKQVEWMGLQRHLKVAGIFARLSLRDGKPAYLADTPRFINYIRSTAGRYRELKPLLPILDEVEGTTAETAYSFGRL